MRLPEHAAHAIRRLERAGFEAWAVGGCVRDSLRGVESHDWDLCTSASPAQMQAVFADARVLTTGLRHGTLTVLTDGGPLEITTYRTEGGYSDGRHPDGVRFVTDIREDLARRDFTVGAMAWHPERGLCDPFGGQTDLKNGVLRAVGDADTRFQEDALRILRGLRFASKLGFAIEPETAAAMRRQVHRLDCIAAERIREELTGLLCGRYVQRTLMAYADLITSALPELAPMQGCQQQNPHHLYDVWEHTLHAMEKVKPEPELRLTMLLHDIGKEAVSGDLDDMDAPLIVEEIHYVRLHAQASYEILKKEGYKETILLAVRHHHENYDGSGYPDNLSGEAIPLGARIIRVCDVYAALTSDRPYRQAFESQSAVQLMIEEIKDFDVKVFLAFQRMIHKNKEKEITLWH